jgi:iron complex outermembrane receptor protein
MKAPLVATFALLAASFASAQTTPPSNDQVAQAASDEVVRLDTFNVSSTIGTYHEETSSMATKVPTDLKELASSLQILNASALADRNAVTLQDVYSYVVGMTQSQVNVNGFTFRGFSNSGGFDQNIQYDGLQGATSNRGAASASNVESIEFLKGPNSVLYGQMHPGGLMNIVTKSPQEVASATITGTYQTYAGAFDSPGDENSYIGSIDLTGPVDSGKHLLYRLIITEQDLQSWRKGDWAKDSYIYPSLTYKWTNDTYVTFKVESIRENERQDDGLIPVFTGPTSGPSAVYTLGPYNTVYQEPTDRTSDEGQSYSTYFQAKLNDIWTLRIQNRTAYNREFIRELTQIVSGKIVTAATPLSATTANRQYNYTDGPHRYCYFDANTYGSFGPKGFVNTVVAGVAGGSEATDARRISFGPIVTPQISVFDPVLGVTPYPADGTKPNDPKQFLTSFGEYISDTITIDDRWHLSLGSRNDEQLAHSFDPLNPITTPYQHQRVSAITSQGGLVYDITQTLSGYVSFSQSFTPTSVTDVDANGNSGFPPEKGYQFEGGLKFESADHNLYVAADTYFINRQNVATSTGLIIPSSGLGIFRLDGEQHSEGVELESEWRPILNWQFQAGLALGKAFVAESITNPATVGQDLVNAPRVSGSFFSRYNFPQGVLKGFGVGLGVTYVGMQWVVQQPTTGSYRIPSWTRPDGDLYYQWKRYKVSLNCENLLDTRYIQIGRAQEVLVPGDERRLTLAVTTRF